VTDELGNTTETRYDRLGRVFQSVDVHGNVSTDVFDARYQVGQSTGPDGLMTRTLHDATGRGSYMTDPFVPGQSAPVGGTHFLYDAAGRAKRTERVKGLVIDVAVAADGTGTASLLSAGTLVSASETEYDPAGRVTSVVDFVGTASAARSEYEY